MRIIVFSDSHGNINTLREIAWANKSADFFIHLGDCVREAEILRSDFPGLNILYVIGNCDFAPFPGTPAENILNCPGGKVFYTHGHMYGVKNGTSKLAFRAKALGADIACFGHTHSPGCVNSDGLLLLNPGSVALPRGGEATYGQLDIAGNGITAKILSCRDIKIRP